MRSFTVNVTNEVINCSTEANSSKCMIAQALRLQGASSVSVTAESARFNFKGVRYSYPLPAKAAEKLKEFDKGNPTLPFKFVLSSNTGTSAPVKVRETKYTKSKHSKRAYTKPTVKYCVRRFHGLKVIEVTKELENGK